MNRSNQTDPFEKNHIFLKFKNVLSLSSLLLILIGVFGNLISFIVFKNKKTRTIADSLLSIYCLSSTLALIGLLNEILYDVFCYYGLLTPLNLVIIIYPYIYPITVTFQLYSIWLTVAVSMVQFSIVRSKKPRTKDYQRLHGNKDYIKSIKIAISIFIVSFIYCLPYWLIYSYSEEDSLNKTEISQNDFFIKIVHFWMYFPFVYLIPFSILMCTNSYLIAKISFKGKKYPTPLKKDWMTNLKRIESSNAEKKMESENLEKLIKLQSLIKQKRSIANRTNLMFVMQILLFFVCQFPNLILNIFAAFDFKVDYYHREVAKFLLICNLSLNFLIYYLFSSKFKNNLREKLSAFFKRK